MKKLYTLTFLIFNSALIFGQFEGTWKMAPQAQALGVGESFGDFSWWSNTEEDVTTRACFFDDEFVFEEDGTFKNVMGEETWLEQWQGVTDDMCGAPVAPHDGSNPATWTFIAAENLLVITGVGAHIGLPKVINGAEIDDPANAPEEISYPVSFSPDENTMVIDISFGPGIWHFVLERQGVSDVKEDIVDAKLFDIYPNPAGSKIQLSLQSNLDKVVIRDLSGRVLISKNNVSTNQVMDISSLAAGMYTMTAQSDGLQQVKKLIVQ